MPRLTLDSRNEFIDYVRRKVKELINFKEELSIEMTARINEITVKEATALVHPDGYHWRYFNSMIELAIERNLQIPAKVAGKRVNLADRALIQRMYLDASIRVSSLTGESRRRARTEFSDHVVYGFDHNVDKDTGEVYKPSHLSVYCFYAITHGSPDKTIIFPSGRLSKGKE